MLSWLPGDGTNAEVRLRIFLKVRPSDFKAVHFGSSQSMKDVSFAEQLS